MPRQQTNIPALTTILEGLEKGESQYVAGKKVTSVLGTGSSTIALLAHPGNTTNFSEALLVPRFRETASRVTQKAKAFDEAGPHKGLVGFRGSGTFSLEGENGTLPYLLLDAAHASFRDVIDFYKAFDVHPTYEEFSMFAQPLLRTLAHLFDEGVILNDVNPGNILLSGTKQTGLELLFGDLGDTPRGSVHGSWSSGLELTSGYDDFSQDELATTDGNLIISPYLAPEIVFGGDTTLSSAMYSLGVVLYEFLTGEFPTTTFDPRFVNPDLPAHTTLIFKSLLHPDSYRAHPQLVVQKIADYEAAQTITDELGKGVSLMTVTLRDGSQEYHLRSVKKGQTHVALLASGKHFRGLEKSFGYDPQADEDAIYFTVKKDVTLPDKRFLNRILNSSFSLPNLDLLKAEFHDSEYSFYGDHTKGTGPR